MRIGMMLRSIDEKGGIGVYARNITRELLERDRDNEYVLFYRNPENLGRFESYGHAKEVVVRAPNKALWDQVSIPWASWRHGVDVLFHPKFTVPLVSPCKSVMVLHGAGWFMPDFAKFWGKWDLKYVRASMPVYCRRAAVVLAVSEITRETFERELGIPEGKIRAVYFAPASFFGPVRDQAELARVKSRYGLPDRFVVTLSGWTKGARKNIDVIVEAFRRHHGRTDHKLVVVGKDCDKFKEPLGIPDDGWGADVLFPGYIEQEDLPAIYNLADVFLYPSFVEAFPVPITESLACGAPIITSDQNGLREIAGDAARYVDPRDASSVVAALDEVLGDDALRQEMSRRSLEQSKRYTWERCTAQTLQAIKDAYES